MKLRLIADSDLRRTIVTGARRRTPTLGFAAGVFPDNTPDPEVLAVAAEADRVLVSHDVNTMPAHFAAFVSRRQSPGLLLIPQSTSTAEAITRLLALCDAFEHEDMKNLVPPCFPRSNLKK